MFESALFHEIPTMANSWRRLYIAAQAVEACNRQARLGFADPPCTHMIDLRRQSLMALQRITMPCGKPCSGVFPDCTTPICLRVQERFLGLVPVRLEGPQALLSTVRRLNGFFSRKLLGTP